MNKIINKMYFFLFCFSRAILTNQDVLPSTPVSSVWQDDFWGTPLTHSGSHKSYRPLTVLSFRLNYLAGGFRPSGYHLVNVLLHCAATALVVRLAKVLFGHRRIFAVLVSGTLFASHPVHTEAVAGVVGRADVGACIFFLLSFLSYVSHVRYRDKSEVIEGEEALLAAASRKWSYLAACLLFATCAILTKEQGITVLVVCALYDLILHLRKDPEFSLRDLFTKVSQTFYIT
jgi:4-amino-4-deoxy-L-arabinose transferase-like glycosyltransferase